jgi:hypothetical protein
MPQRQHVLEAWNSYRKIVMAADAPRIQVVEIRRAFYAGIVAVINLIDTGISDGPGITPEDLDFMTAIRQELREYGKQIGVTT